MANAGVNQELDKSEYPAIFPDLERLPDENFFQDGRSPEESGKGTEEMRTRKRTRTETHNRSERNRASIRVP
jgi:hypothetical protein